MSNRKSNLRWGVERRLEFIEFRLYWEGRINRGHLMDTFGVSINQASTDLNRYLGLAPENMVYDRSARTYVRSGVFSPIFLKLDSDHYLRQIRALHDPAAVSEADVQRLRDESWLLTYPEFDEMPSLLRTVNSETLRLVVESCREKQSMEILYQSLTSPEARWRWIAPHALGFSGSRWHVRAFCEEERAFKDFVLARIIETGSTRPRESDPAEDRDWHQYVELAIGPNPGLSESQQKIVARDYRMEAGRVTVKVRKALLFYTLRRLGLNKDAVPQPPASQQIVLLNPEVLQSPLYSGPHQNEE